MPRFLPIAAIVVPALVALAGCTTYHAQPLAPEDLAHRFEQRSLAGEPLHAYVVRTLGHDIAPWPPRTWNRELLTLAAWYYSPTLAVARARSASAHAGIGVAAAVPNPTLQLPFQYATPNPGPGAPFTVGPALDIPIETAGKRGDRIEQAKHLSQAARFDADTAAWQVGAQVRDALIALHSAQTRIELSASHSADTQAIVAMLQRRHAAGAASGSDVTAATLIAEQAQRAQAAARTAQSDARAQLAAAIGVPASAVEGIRIDLSSLALAPPAPPDTDAQRAAIFLRTDLLSSLADYAASESALRLEVAKQYPDLHLGPGYTYDTGTHKIAFGLAGITLPIFDQNQGGIREAESKRKEAATRTAALQDKILSDLDLALSRYRAARAALHSADAQLSTAKRQLDDQAAQFSSGETDRLSYTKAKADFETNKSARLDALVAAQQAGAAVEDAMQRPLEPEAIYMPPHRQEATP